MTSTCPKYSWCELDHTNPEVAQHGDIHEKRGVVTVGEFEQDFSLEIDATGQPRLEAALDQYEVWVEPGESTNSLRELSELYKRMADAYDEFLRMLTEDGRHRAHSVDDAVTAEVRTLVAERGWTFKQAATAFGLPAARVGNLLCRQTRWSIADLLAVARVTGSDEDEELERLLGIARGATVGS
ncbi:hypothetical protein [uncultured Microbacterium sp.]|uniref:hypothetical protein n=1 Tax=uncultured Microbacterium sp. TaxID=191216 RepID=UPI0025D73D20|nr:hypothetical protein [uncultured Microbacterium sp.]